jgi:hypothetical protein
MILTMETALQARLRGRGVTGAAMRVAAAVGLAALAQFIPAAPAEAQPDALPDAAWSRLPRWRGFNLIEKFNAGRNEPFREEDFRLISELGFNFVRLPMDYRCWIVDGDWRRLREDTLREIDQAVEYGGRYNVHVCLNFHRAPGYTVAKPPEPKSLWTDPDAQEVCAMHWAAFARRYKGIPNRRLSFNLLNEPAGVGPEAHAAAIRKLVDAIRAEDPERLIICDAREWGTAPCDELVLLQVAQATRGYQPMEVTHFEADWVRVDPSVKPAWPRVNASGWLAGPWKRDLMAPLRVTGSFAGVRAIRVRVHEVSSKSRLVVRAGERTILDHAFECGPAEGEWKEAIYRPEWQIYQNVYDRDYTADLPDGTKELAIENVDGDWMTLREIGLRRADGREEVLPLLTVYGAKAPEVAYRAGEAVPFAVRGSSGRAWLREECVKPFQALEAKGVGVMVGEFGAFNRTPHPVVLRWMRDCLANWDAAGWGWALWNFRGSFGVLDSEREDVAYEDWNGHKLDRQMLDLLTGRPFHQADHRSEPE